MSHITPILAFGVAVGVVAVLLALLSKWTRRKPAAPEPRICSACHERIGRDHKYLDRGKPTVRHRDCANPKLAGQTSVIPEEAA